MSDNLPPFSPPSTPTSPPKLSENASVEYFDLLHANILVVGQTGSGKSTFVETLKDPRHFSSFGVVSSTTAASLHDLGFRVGHDNYSLSVIDTPGMFLSFFSFFHTQPHLFQPQVSLTPLAKVTSNSKP